MFLAKTLVRYFGPPVGYSDTGSGSLGYLGYPSVYQAATYKLLEKQSGSELRLSYPSMCAVCGSSQHAGRNFQFRTGIFRSLTVVKVPVCDLHLRERNPPLLVSSMGVGGQLLRVTLLSKSKQFIDSLQRIFDDVAPPMPWQAFPDISAESSGWRQGDAENWWKTCWMPYWKNATPDLQREIIEKEAPSDGWKERLKNLL